MSRISTREICTFEVLAVHYNPSPPLTATLEGVEHAHTFSFLCKRKLSAAPKSWSANNLREDCEEVIHDFFADHRYGVLNFESNDCISLAELLIRKLELCYCAVSEAGIGGVELIVNDEPAEQVYTRQQVNRIFGPPGLQ